MKKVKKSFWEHLFTYPSFNIRFFVTLILVLFFFFVATFFLLFKTSLVNGTSNVIIVLALIVQSATLVLGIFGAYYALRQLVETRFTALDEAGLREIKQQHYSRAFNKWKEALYIRPEASIFANLCETLLLIGDFDTFDKYMKKSQSTGSLKEEISDQVTLLYLKSIRHLLVKNQGEAERNLSALVDLIKKDGFSKLQWDFLDLKTSQSYLDLSGECKNIAENLISYLSGTITPLRKNEFENKNYSSQVVE